MLGAGRPAVEKSLTIISPVQPRHAQQGREPELLPGKAEAFRERKRQIKLGTPRPHGGGEVAVEPGARPTRTA